MAGPLVFATLTAADGQKDTDDLFLIRVFL